MDFKMEKGSVIAVLKAAAQEKPPFCAVSFLEQADREGTLMTSRRTLPQLPGRKLKGTPDENRLCFPGLYNLFRNKAAPFQNVLEGLGSPKNLCQSSGPKELANAGKSRHGESCQFLRISSAVSSSAWPLQEPLPITRKWCCLMSHICPGSRLTGEVLDVGKTGEREIPW